MCFLSFLIILSFFKISFYTKIVPVLLLYASQSCGLSHLHGRHNGLQGFLQ